ncbi:MAG: addiction module protein [Firmicutes bacterium]|nr:addiction module protein [Bacillota bacterium]
MSTRLPMPPPSFDVLSIPEKLAYLQSLWDRIASGGEQLPIPDWHRQALRERLQEQVVSEEQQLD